MKNRKSVDGVNATAPRPTKVAAMMLACIMAVPVFFLLSLLEWLFF